MLDKLKELRVKNNLSYQNMADSLGISKAYYWQLENGNRRLFYDLAKEIADKFNLKPDDIFYSKDKQYKRRKSKNR